MIDFQTIMIFLVVLIILFLILDNVTDLMESLEF